MKSHVGYSDKPSVPTPKGPLEFAPVPLFHGRREIDKLNAEKNLHTLADVFDAAGVRFGLIYGTLLGAIRDQDFITWDEDIDVFILAEQRDAFHNCLWDLKIVGMELVRCEDDLYSIMRGGDYIDIYVFEKKGADRVCGLHVIPEVYIEFRDTIFFKGRDFFVPSNRVSLLNRLYGKDWMLPKRDSPAQPYTRKKKLAMFLKDRVPALHGALQRIFGTI